MLQDLSSIDLIIRPEPGLTMLVITDAYPWPDPEAAERVEQFKSKLSAYANYVASEDFYKDDPKGDRAGVVISVVTPTRVPPSKAMKAITEVWTPGEPSYQIVVRFGKGAPPVPKRPWWKFW